MFCHFDAFDRHPGSKSTPEYLVEEGPTLHLPQHILGLVESRYFGTLEDFTET